MVEPLTSTFRYSAEFRFFLRPDFGKRFRRVDSDDRPCYLEIANCFFESTGSKEVDSADYRAVGGILGYIFPITGLVME